jgi:hypothetical protein
MVGLSPGRVAQTMLFAGVLVWLLGCQTGVANPREETNMPDYLELSEFRGGDAATRGTWQGFSDRVMGGVSDLTARVVEENGDRFLRMSGHVSTRNNGGFIQVRLLLGSDMKPFDGSPYRGIRLVARGSGQGYYLHIRTAGMMLPWKYYAAAVTVSEAWSTINIPWSAFEPGDFGRMGRFDPRRLKSLAVVAAKGDFDALIDVREVGMYGAAAGDAATPATVEHRTDAGE